jgi:hypothetical protein
MSRGGAAPVLALAAAVLLAGCSQEGKLIQTPLPVRGVALEYDVVRRTDVTDTTGIDTTTINVPFKILLHAANPCEAKHPVLELRLLGVAPLLVYEMTPVARYNADDKCVLQTPTAVDTPIVLTVSTLTMVTAAATARRDTVSFKVENAGGLPFYLTVDSVVTSSVVGTVGFEVRVQDATTAAPVLGATVAIDTVSSTGVTIPVGSGTTDAQGLYALNVPEGGFSGEIGPRYRITVNPGPNQLVFYAPSAPSRCGRRERIYLRI